MANRRHDRDTEIPSASTPLPGEDTRLALERMTDRARFQDLCDRVLSAHFGYEVQPRGVNARGTVVGQPDSLGTDKDGRSCAIAHGTDKKWKDKLHKDLKDTAAIQTSGQAGLEVFVFCTNRHVDATVEREEKLAVLRDYGWELRIYGQSDLAVPLDTDLQDLRLKYLGIAVERHNWTSLMEACALQRRRALARYQEEREPSVFVPRSLEVEVGQWYEEARRAIASGGTSKQLFPVVDQSGAGKSTLMLHLCEEYGARVPVLLIPGGTTIPDDHALEQEICTAVGYPLLNRVFQADLRHLCRLAAREGAPFLVIIDALDNSPTPDRLRGALTQLLLAVENEPLLVLCTCRDAFWPHLYDMPWHDRIFQTNSAAEGPGASDRCIPLGLYSDDEFQTALEYSFRHWNVDVVIGDSAAKTLRLPLLLRIFCETFQGRHLGYVAEVAAADLWHKYLEHKIDVVWTGIGRTQRKGSIRAIIERIALRMLERDSPVLTLDEAASIDGLMPENTAPNSLYLQLRSAAILHEDASGTLRFMHESSLEFLLSRALAQALDRTGEKKGALARLENLATTGRWRQVVVQVAAQVAAPDEVIERIYARNRWLGTEALVQGQGKVSSSLVTSIVDALRSELRTGFAVNRRRASDLLGRLGAAEARDELMRLYASSEGSVRQVALIALARLDVTEIIDAFIAYLARDRVRHRPADQALIDGLSPAFCTALTDRAVSLLQDADGSPAAHVLGYLRAPDAVHALSTYIVRVQWSDWVALYALLRIGTGEAMAALEEAVDQTGAYLSEKRAAERAAHKAGDEEKKKRIHGEWEAQYFALDGLRLAGFQHSAPDKVVPLLTRMLASPHFDVGHQAMTSLQHLGALQHLANSHQYRADTFLEIMIAIGGFGARPTVEQLLSLLKGSQLSPAATGYVIRALGASRDRRAVAPLVALVRERQHLIEAIPALGELGRPEAATALLEVMDDETGPSNAGGWWDLLRNAAVVSLGKLSLPDTYERVADYIEKHPPFSLEFTYLALVQIGMERAIASLCSSWHIVSSTRRQALVALIALDD